MPETDTGQQAELVFDTTILSNFAVCNAIEPLAQLYRDRAYTTIMVLDELQNGVRAGYQYLKLAEEIIHPDGWIKILPLQEHREQQIYMQLQSHLHMGEASCLALASARRMILATDDLAARKMARKHNVLLTGTIGILVRMVKGKVIQLEAANQLLSTMIAFEYHSPVQRLDDFVK